MADPILAKAQAAANEARREQGGLNGPDGNGNPIPSLDSHPQYSGEESAKAPGVGGHLGPGGD